MNRNVLNRSAGAGSVPDQLAQMIRDDIASGRFAAGDKVPTEHALCKRFGVSRPAVREAMAQLKQDGLIESRQGTAATVTGMQSAFRIKLELFRDPEELAQIFELRTVFETGSAALAATQHGEENLRNVYLAFEEMERALADNGDGVLPDTHFHRAIAEATGNRYFAEFISYLGERLQFSIQASRSGLRIDQERARAVHGEHAAILRAIVSRDSEQARAAMLLHLRNAAEDLGLSPASRLSGRRERRIDLPDNSQAE